MPAKYRDALACLSNQLVARVALPKEESVQTRGAIACKQPTSPAHKEIGRVRAGLSRMSCFAWWRCKDKVGWAVVGAWRRVVVVVVVVVVMMVVGEHSIMPVAYDDDDEEDVSR